MRKILIRDGRLVDPANGVDESGLDLLLADGVVAGIGRALSVADDAEVIDAAGRVVTPGLIDMHVHLREPGREDDETIGSGLAAAAAGGFTAVACMPNTQPVNDDPAVTRFILRQGAFADAARVWPIAAATKGSDGKELSEYGLLKEAGAVAVSDDGLPLATAEIMRRSLEYAAQFDLVVIDHLEDPSLSPGWCMNEGAVSAQLGLTGVAPASEEIVFARDAILATLTGGRFHAAHVSTAGTVRRVREEKARGVPVTAEVTPHHFTLTDEQVGDYDTNAKMSPPLRARSDVDAIIAGLADGTIDCIASDHAPHHVDRKLVEFDVAAKGVVGLETVVSIALDRLLHAGVVDLGRLVELLSTNPARILGVPGGQLGEGSVADVTLIDLDRRVRVDPDRFRTLGRNCPFAGWELRGAPVATIVGGRRVWSAAGDEPA